LGNWLLRVAQYDRDKRVLEGVEKALEAVERVMRKINCLDLIKMSIKIKSPYIIYGL